MILQVCLLASSACFTPAEAITLRLDVGKCVCDTQIVNGVAQPVTIYYRTAQLQGAKLVVDQDPDVIFRSTRAD